MKIHRHTDKYFTKENLPFTKARDYDAKDDVDRLSYCDNTTMIIRSMQAGKQLQFNNAQALYNDMKMIEDNQCPVATPVYQDDPVIAQQKMDALREATAKFTAGLSSGSGSNSGLAPDVKPAEAGAEPPKAEHHATGSPVLSETA